MEKIEVLEQVDTETKEAVDKLEKDYAIALDGSIVKINQYFDNPETSRDAIK